MLEAQFLAGTHGPVTIIHCKPYGDRRIGGPTETWSTSQTLCWQFLVVYIRVIILGRARDGYTGKRFGIESLMFKQHQLFCPPLLCIV